MDQPTTLQHLEYLEAGFEVSKVLAHAGYRMDAPAFVITWGQVAETLAHTLADYGLPADRLEEELIVKLTESGAAALASETELPWRDRLRQVFTRSPELAALLAPTDCEEHEGPLTERYENATRLGDEESYWIDGGASADLFDEG